MQTSPEPDEEAAAWVVKLGSGQATEEDYPAFRAWRDRSVENREALARARLTWVKLGSALPRLELGRKSNWFWNRPTAAAAALAACLLLSIGLGFEYWHNWRFDLVTGTAEVRVASLPDGSRITLAPGTAIKTDYRATARRIELARGRALFDVRHNPAIPFTVTAGATEVRDIGTVFEVDAKHAGARVVVSQGVVSVSDRHSDTLVRANQAVGASDGNVGPVVAVDSDQETAWTRGLLIFDDRDLATIVGALRPYHGAILLLNSAAGRRKVTAVVNADRIDSWLDSLGKTRVAKVTRVGGIVLIW
jgi:transmembrane sensor